MIHGTVYWAGVWGGLHLSHVILSLCITLVVHAQAVLTYQTQGYSKLWHPNGSSIAQVGQP